jgi:sugar phosphate isomerase/epimerase
MRMPKLKIGLSMLHCLSESYAKMIKRLNKVETQYVEVLDEGLHALSKKRVATLNQIAKSRGFRYTVHAPFADINIASPSKPILTASVKRLKESMGYATELASACFILEKIGDKTSKASVNCIKLQKSTD